MNPVPPSRQAAGPYLCYARTASGWLPPVEVSGAEDAWMWLVNPLRAPFDELRVTDATGEECLIHVEGDELKFPTPAECRMTEERWREFWTMLSEQRREARRRMVNE